MAKASAPPSPESFRRRQKRRRLILAAAVLVPLVGFLIFSSYGLGSRLRLEMEHAELHERMQAAAVRRDSLQAEIKRLNTDTLFIERLARERFGMIRPGERVYLLEQPQED